MIFTWKPSLQLIPRPSDSRLLWNPYLLGALHIYDDILGHPNWLVPMLVFHTNFVGNHLPIMILLENIRCCFIDLLDVSVGDAIFLSCSPLLLFGFYGACYGGGSLLLILLLLLSWLAFVGLVTTFMAHRASHG